MVFSSLSSSINESYHLSMLLVYSIFRRDGWFKYGRLPVVMLAPPEVLKVPSARQTNTAGDPECLPGGVSVEGGC